MKPFTKTVLLGCILLLVSDVAFLFLGKNASAIPASDSFWVSAGGSTALLIAGGLLFLIFLGLGISTKFASLQINGLFVIALTLAAFINHRIIRLQNNYLAEAINEEALEQEPYLLDLENKIDLNWGLLGLWLVSICLLLVRILLLWQKRHAG